MVFDGGALVNSASQEAKLAEYADDIWRKILRPLFAPYVEDPNLKENSQVTNLFLVINYLEGFRTSVNFDANLQKRCIQEGWILPTFDIDTAPFEEKKTVKITSRQVLELIKTL
jgi:hypothetical protein